MLKILKMGSLESVHIGIGPEAMFSSDHTDFILPLATGHLSCMVFKVCTLSIIFQNPYLVKGYASGDFFLNPWHEVGKSSSFFSVNREKVSVPI